MPPVLFGRPDATNREKQSLMRLAGLCVSREINLFASGRSSPIVEWLKNLCREAHRECGGEGVGVIGMCLTGGFALSMAVDPAVLAPVLAQPGLPVFGHSKIDISSTDLESVRQRIRRKNSKSLDIGSKKTRSAAPNNSTPYRMNSVWGSERTSCRARAPTRTVPRRARGDRPTRSSRAI